MSKSIIKTQGKSSHPLHSSFILNRNSLTAQQKKTNQTQLSHFYTKATSEFDFSSAEEQQDIKERYETRLRNLSAGYERTRQQYEDSLKNMYKQKIILLNIIAHNQTLVEEFRNKVDQQTGSFKEVQAKYNFISSGILHGKLCCNCVMKASNLNIQMEIEREQIKISRTRNEERKKTMAAVKQYSWMYAPNVDRSTVAVMRKEIEGLKGKMEEQAANYTRKIAQKDLEIKQLKQELTEISAPTHRIIIVDEKRQEKTKAHLHQLKAKVSELQSKANASNVIKQQYESLLKHANEALTQSQLLKLNSKYRSKFL